MDRPLLKGSVMENNRTKRRSQRVAATLPVTWVRSGKRIGAFTGDIGGDGLFLRTDEVIDPGYLMHLEVSLPGEAPLVMFVCARFVGRTDQGTGIGVQLFVISESDKKRWNRYYRSQLARSREETARPALQVG